MRHLFAAAAFVLTAAPALACTPMPPEYVPPPPMSVEDKARQIHGYVTDIVYGVVTSTPDQPLRFKVLHVYKGNLRKGAMLSPRVGYGFDAPGCPEMELPPAKGTAGVIAFNTDPELSFLSEERLKAMFDAGLIRSAQAR